VFECAIGFATANNAQAQDPTQDYLIRARHSQKCLDVSNFGITNGTRMWQWTCGFPYQNNQTFNITPAGNGTWRITAASTAKCVDISGIDAAPPNNPTYYFNNGAMAQQWTCNTASAQENQTFYFVASEIPGYYRIKAAHSLRCLDVSNISLADGALIQQWDCAGFTQDNQLWRLEPVGVRATARTNVKYFGYWSVGAGSAEQPQVADHANLVLATNATQIAAAAAAGLKAVVPISGTGIWISGAPEGAFLNPYASSLWPTYASSISAQINNVAFFYLADEPFWNGMNGGYTAAQIQSALQGGAALIKASFPNTPIAYMEATPAVGSILQTASVDWIGFDCYGPFDNCGGTSIPAWVTLLKTRIQAQQKIWLSPYSSFTTSPILPADTIDRVAQADRYVELALSDPRIIALMNWTFVARSPGYPKGTVDQAELLARWKFLGRTLGFGTP
jgi:hypothetical protein